MNSHRKTGQSSQSHGNKPFHTRKLGRLEWSSCTLCLSKESAKILSFGVAYSETITMQYICIYIDTHEIALSW